MKKYSVMLSVALCLTIAVASFSRESVDDFKNRKYGDLPLGYEIKLVQNFEGLENWTINSQPVNITAYVQNGDINSNPEQSNFESGYIRLSIKEYLAESKLHYIYSENRLLIDENGEFVKSISREQALELGRKFNPHIKDDDLVQEISVYDEESVANLGGYWYIKTSSAFSNGFYGRFLLKNIEIDEEGYTSLSSEPSSNPDVKINSLDDVDLSDYSTFKWHDKDTEKGNIIREYVSLNLGNKVISLEEWIANGSELTESWIYDTDSEQGWVYWGQPLKHALDTTNTLKSKTENLIESAQLIKSSTGKIIYGLDVRMDAVSFDSLESWQDAPIMLIDAFKSNEESSSGLDYSKLKVSYQEAKGKFDRLTLINRYTTESYENLRVSLNKVAEMLITLDANNQFEINQLESELNESLSSLKLNIQISESENGKRVINFAGKDWTIIDSKDDESYFIVSDPFTREELIDLEVSEEFLVGDEMYFSKDKDYGEGYGESLLSTVNTNFYEKNIHNTYLESFVIPVTLGNEQIIPSNTIEENLQRLDSPTTVDYANGKKQAFTLSMSDWNASSARKRAKDIYGNIKLWTTTPGELDKNNRVKNIISMLFE